MTLPPDPALTKRYPAIDGIAVLAQPPEVRECNTSGQMYSYQGPATPAVRADIVALFSKPPHEFHIWLAERREATFKRLRQLELIASIPQLSYGPDGGNNETFESWTCFNEELRLLRAAMETLDILETRYKQRIP